MIINEVYDKSLWLVVKNDKKNRDMIVDFMNSVPDRLYDTMKMFANIACSCMKDNSFYLDNGNSVITPDGIMYWFRIDRYNYGLTLGYSIFDGHNYEPAWEMTLYPFEESKLDKYELIASVCDVSTGRRSDDNEIKYLLQKDKYGYMISILSEQKIRSKDANFGKMPKDIELSDLRKSNRLVLKRIFNRNK